MEGLDIRFLNGLGENPAWLDTALSTSNALADMYVKFAQQNSAAKVAELQAQAQAKGASTASTSDTVAILLALLQQQQTAPTGMSTGAKIAIGVASVAGLGLLVYLLTQKKK